MPTSLPSITVVTAPNGTPGAAASPDTLSVTLSLYDRYAQIVDFGHDSLPILSIDEPPPLGEGHGPNPTRVLAAAIGSCLASSLLFCLRKSRIDVRALRTRVDGRLVRNAHGRLRIAGFAVTITPTVRPEDVPRMERCLELFEDYCTVTESVRDGIDVGVRVTPAATPASADRGVPSRQDFARSFE